MNGMSAVKELLKDKTKSFKMVNFEILHKEFGDQILGDTIISFGGEICYDTRNYPTVKLSHCFINCSVFKEVKKNKNIKGKL